MTSPPTWRIRGFGGSEVAGEASGPGRGRPSVCSASAHHRSFSAPSRIQRSRIAMIDNAQSPPDLSACLLLSAQARRFREACRSRGGGMTSSFLAPGNEWVRLIGKSFRLSPDQAFLPRWRGVNEQILKYLKGFLAFPFEILTYQWERNGQPIAPCVRVRPDRGRRSICRTESDGPRG